MLLPFVSLLLYANVKVSAFPSLHPSWPSAAHPVYPRSVAVIPSFDGKNATAPRQGWTPSPDGRGTIDILWTSLLTIILCSWTANCPNIPSPGSSAVRKFLDRLYMAGFTVMSPELTMQLALCQWSSARRSVAQFAASGPDYAGWTMRHAFFADAGGFVLHTSDFPPIPANAKQCHYLLARGYIDRRELIVPEYTIKDKDKQDGIARLISVAQIMWFSANALGRLAQRLDVTVLELTVLGFNFCTLITYFLWRHKTVDADSGLPLRCRVSLADIIRDAEKSGALRPDMGMYRLTPLDFVGREEWSFTIAWAYGMHTLQRVGIRFSPPKRPVAMFPNGTFPKLSGRAFAIMFVAQLLYTLLPFVAWNGDFPTDAERIVWRTSASCMLGWGLLYWLMDRWIWHALPHIRERLGRSTGKEPYYGCEDGTEGREGKRGSVYGELIEKRVEKRKWGKRSLADRLRNNSNNGDPNYYLPLKGVFTLGPSVVFYCLARCCVLVGGFAVLRALPPSAYQTVNWSLYIPHL